MISGTSPERASEATSPPMSLVFSVGILPDSPALVPSCSPPAVWASGTLSPLLPHPVASAAGATVGPATPGAALAIIDSMLEDISSIRLVHGIVTSVVDEAFASPQLHVFTVVVIGTLGTGTGTVLLASSTLSVHPQCITVIVVVAVVMPFSHISQTSTNIVVMAVGCNVIKFEIAGRVSGGPEAPILLRLPPLGARMTVTLLAVDMTGRPVTGDDEAAEVKSEEELPVLDIPIGRTMTLPETVELDKIAELDDDRTTGPGTRSVLL